MWLKPTTNLLYLLSGALLLAALVLHFLNVFGLIESTPDLVLWIAIVGWLTGGVAALLGRRYRTDRSG